MVGIYLMPLNTSKKYNNFKRKIQAISKDLKILRINKEYITLSLKKQTPICR